MKTSKLTVTLALLATAMALISSGCSENARAAPGDPVLETIAQEADSVTYRATIPPGRNPDGTIAPNHDWRTGPDDGGWNELEGTIPAADSASDGTLSTTFTVPRDSTETPAFFCVSARNDVGSSEQACADYTIPALALPPSMPGSPTIDTVEVASLGADSLVLYDLDASSEVRKIALEEGQTSGGLTAIAYRGGHAYLCATVEGYGQGWYELASVDPELMIASPGSLVPDDRPECGVTWETTDPEVATLSESGGTFQVPIEGDELRLARLSAGVGGRRCPGS